MKFLKTFFVYFILIASTLFLFAFTYRIWKYDYLTYPITYSHDGVESLKLIKNIAQGNSHWQTNYDLGYPHGSNLYVNFPTPDFFSLVLIQIITIFTKNHFIIYNLFILISYILVSLVSLYILKKLKIRYLYAMPLALLFSFLPYHQIRASVGHIFLTQYFTVPLSIYISLLLTSKYVFDGKSLKTILEIIFFVILIAGTGTAYYQFFSIIIWFISSLIHKYAHKSWRSFKTFIFLATLLSIITISSVLPSITNSLIGQGNFDIIKRNPIQTEEFGLRLNRLIMPLQSNLVPFANSFLINYYQYVQHEQYQFVGIPAIIGLVVGIFSILRKKQKHNLKKLGLLSLGIIAFGSSGGLALIFAHAVSSSIRSYGRLSIFLAFIGIYAFALIITGFKKKSHIITTLLFIFFSTFYQISMFDPHNNAWSIYHAFDEDREIIERLNEKIPTDSKILQLPLIPYPEARGECEFDSYDLFKPYLHNNSFKWSFGHVSSQEEINNIKIQVESEDEEIDAHKLITYAVTNGFNIIYLDTKSCLPAWDLQAQILNLTDGTLHTSTNMSKLFIDITSKN